MSVMTEKKKMDTTLPHLRYEKCEGKVKKKKNHANDSLFKANKSDRSSNELMNKQSPWLSYVVFKVSDVPVLSSDFLMSWV